MRLQFQIKCPFPQKVHLSLRWVVSASKGMARGQQCTLLIAAMINLVNSAKMVLSCAVLTAQSRLENEGGGVVDNCVAKEKRVL